MTIPEGDFPFTSHSVQETRGFAATFATDLKPGDIVTLEGELGAGKTEFVRGVCEALGIGPESVSSPSFTLVNEYRGGLLPIFHFDAYRIKSAAEFFELGYEEYFDADGVCFVEWPERIESLLDDQVIGLKFEHKGPSERLISRVK